ncbi:conjugal transfer protein TraF [Parasulfuritortus cantonensis]|nr:conjugal transfer protein TraF [Parasulfuritortus cantonensis]
MNKVIALLFWAATALLGGLGASQAMSATPMPAAVDAQATEAPKPFLKERETGWFWYKDPQPEPAPSKKSDSRLDSHTSEAAAAKPPEVRMYEKFKADMVEARIVAMFNPTQANVERYVQYRTALVRLADQFAEAGQRVVWANPQYDFTQERPVNVVGLEAYKQEQAKLQRETLERLAKGHVLYFFFRSDCPHCHAFAPVLLGFSRATGIQVFPVSLDGGGLPEFPRPHRDRGQADALGVTQVPALYLANPSTRDVVAVGFGTLSETELIDRLVAIANPSASQYVDAATPVRSLEGFEP